jgi:pimeloyl-ACP methyl ester carboxylesterase
LSFAATFYSVLLSHRFIALCALVLLTGCAGVKVSSIEPSEYLAQRRADVLTSGTLSAATRESLRVIGSESKPCLAQADLCRQQIRQAIGLSDEQRLSALAELWTQEAMLRDKQRTDEAIDAWMETARYAWAYLFFTAKDPVKRAFEDRQTQVRDYYNFAAQQAITELFRMRRDASERSELSEVDGDKIHWRQWQLSVDLSDIHQLTARALPHELIAASSLSFSGLRNLYRRDGFGAELVAVFDKPQRPADHVPLESAVFEEARIPAVTVVLEFAGDSLDQVLSTRQVTVRLHDPYRRSEVKLGGSTVPLAGNFTSGYGLWLARSNFSTEALRTLLGKSDGLGKPQIHLMQPYDPNRRLIVMLHGLASSPEAWINVANEVLGDEQLRRNFQIWQVYYPTNAPIVLNNYTIREALQQTLRHFDPQGTALASRDITLVGHSMGGVLARMMVSGTQGKMVDAVAMELELPAKARQQLQGELASVLEFSPVPNVHNAIFIAAPHRGTDFANHRFVRWASNLVTMPFSMLEKFADAALAVANASPRSSTQELHIPNSIDNLSDKDMFLRAAANLPIAPDVRYYSIIGNNTPSVPLEQSSDGVVPYTSSHLAGAQSELVIRSGHSVQETPQAIIELRRILRAELSTAY